MRASSPPQQHPQRLKSTHITTNQPPRNHSFILGLEARFGLLVNDEGTRSFLTVGAGAGCDARLRRLVASVDEVVRRYRQPVYYPDPRFHVSVASLRGDAGAVWGEGKGDKEREEEEEEGEEGEGAAAVVVEVVECRIGRKLFEIPLRAV